jgi:predicted small secreted protein
MRAIVTLALTVWLIALAGCNTMEGLGKDIRQLGEKIEKKAQ